MKIVKLIFISTLFVFTMDAEAQISRSDSLLTHIKNYKQQNQYDEVAALYRNLLSVLLQENDSIAWFNQSVNYADNLILAGEVRQAISELKKLDSITVKGVSFGLITKVKRQIGYCYRILEDYDMAMNYYQEGMDMAREAQDSLVMAYFHNNMGVVFQRKGEYDLAFKHLSSALNYHEKSGSKTMVGKISNGIFLNFMRIGLIRQAEPYIKRSLKIFEELQIPRELDIAYHNRAWNFELQDHLDSAIIYYNKSLELTRQIGNPYEINTTLVNIGSLYQQIGEYSSARQFFEEALEISRETGRPLSTAKSLVFLANNALATNNEAQAEEYFDEAYSIFTEHNLPDKLILLHNDLAQFELKRGNYAKAEKYINKSELISQEIDQGKEAFYIYSIKGEIYFARGKYDSSIQTFKKALSYARNKNDQIDCLKFLARLYHKSSSDSAFVYAEQAIQLINELRNRITGFTFGAGSFGNHTGFYNELSSWYLSEKNNPARAFELIEASKSRELLDELARAENEAYSTLPEVEHLTKQQKITRLNSLYDNLEAEQDPETQDSLAAEIRQAELDYQAYLNVLNLANPQARQFPLPEPIKLGAAQDYLDEHTAILEYAFAGTKLVAFFITKDAVQTITVDSVHNSQALEFINQSVTGLLEKVERIDSVESINEASSELYNLLLSDFLQSNPAINQLLIVSAGPISYLPFELLFTENSYLIENYRIKYIPSISILPFIKEPHRADSGLLALASAGLPDDNQTSSNKRATLYASLPSSILEVESIAGHFKRSQVYKDNDLSESVLKTQNLNNYRFLHFATHGKIDLENPSQSGLLVSNRQKNAKEDGFLNNLEISLLNLNADLVVLSACKTGIGKRYSGEGLFGLQRSFLIAGASGVMVSLWDVYDRSTAEFMDHFYSKMLEYQKEDFGLLSKSLSILGLYEHPLFDYKARALQSAKIEMISHPYYSHPVHWAPFILIGK